MLALSCFWPKIVESRESKALCAVEDDGWEVGQVVGKEFLPHISAIAEHFQQEREGGLALGVRFAFVWP